ncbi:hypothetical protein, partial [uncultured Pelagimonas sp.]|uniref:hypothetical protein n=1 Tax=uncultured Pelagimonas sp. TaxID=1618102 RepID=UPI0026356050
MPEVFFDAAPSVGAIESSSGHSHTLRLSEVSTRDVTVTVQIISGTASVESGDGDFDSSTSTS